MNIKNYTSGIAVETTIARIESKLAAAGASGIMKLFDDKGNVQSITFRFESYAIRLPANVESCYEALWKEYCLSVSRPRESTQQTIREQAAKTAWKLIQDWIEVQISMIVMKQAQFLEVFLPYVMVGRNQTFFGKIEADKFKALPERTE